MATITATMTEKQAEYRTQLIDRELNRLAGQGINGEGIVQQRVERLVTAGLILSLPVPATIAEASAQIDALKGVTMIAYAKRHRDWADPILAAVIAAFGPQAENAPTYEPAYRIARRANPTSTAADNAPVIEAQKADWIERVRQAVGA